jgi:hypothetical protein
MKTPIKYLVDQLILQTAVVILLLTGYFIDVVKNGESSFDFYSIAPIIMFSILIYGNTIHTAVINWSELREYRWEKRIKKKESKEQVQLVNDEQKGE